MSDYDSIPGIRPPMGAVFVVAVLTSATVAAGTVYAMFKLSLLPGAKSAAVATAPPAKQRAVSSGPQVGALDAATGAPAPARVPVVVGQPLAAARAAIEAAGLRVGEIKDGQALPPGTVVATDPPPGTEIPPERPITLTVVAEPGQVEVPSVVRMSLGRARRALKEAGLELGRIRYEFDEDKRGGIILRQSPAPKSRVAPGSKVEVLVNDEG